MLRSFQRPCLCSRSVQWHINFWSIYIYIYLYRWSHKSGSNVWIIVGKEGNIDSSVVVHGGTMFGSHMWCRVSKSIDEARLQCIWWWCQRHFAPLLQGHRLGRWDHWHLRPRLHRLLRHRPQKKCPRFPHSGNQPLSPLFNIKSTWLSSAANITISVVMHFPV